MTDPILLKYSAITVSGRVASGATTLSRGLSDILGWQAFNGGEVYRQYAGDMGIPLERTDLSTDKYHLELDELIKKKLNTEKNIIVESWLSGFDARGINGVYKIFVNCSDDKLRVDRLVNREKMTIDQAKEHLKIREEENLKKWLKIYGTSDIWNPRLYDLVIDTYHLGPTEALNEVLKSLGLDKLVNK